MTYESNKEEWDAEWKEAENIEATASPIGIWLRSQRIIHIKDIMKNMDKSLSVIDMGCGAGTTLKVIRGLGFKNSIGIDFSKEAIKRCEKLGFVKDKDVFNMDAGDTGYPDRHFGIGFEEGLWEHFEYPEPLVREAARISDEYMLIIQPNHFTPLGGLLHWAWKVFSGGGVFEYSFHMDYFIGLLDECGFELVDRRRDWIWAQDVILFRRKD